jgi:hypothetical protein
VVPIQGVPDIRASAPVTIRYDVIAELRNPTLNLLSQFMARTHHPGCLRLSLNLRWQLHSSAGNRFAREQSGYEVSALGLHQFQSVVLQKRAVLD